MHTVEKKDRFLPHFGHFSKMQLLNLANTNLMLHSECQNTALMEILDHSVPSLVFCRCLKLENLLHKSTLMTRKCKILELRWFAHLGIYRTTSARAPSLISTPSRIVRTPYIRIIPPINFLTAFGQVKIVYQCQSYFKSRFLGSKMPKISKHCSKIEVVFFLKKLISLIVRMRTNRGSMEHGNLGFWTGCP